MSSTVHDLLDRLQPDVLAVNGNFPLDQNVIAALPTGTRVLSSDRSGTSTWAFSARITAEVADGTLTRYFMKCATGNRGRVIIQGEYASMSEIQKVMPDFVPMPYTWGRYQNDEVYFLLSDFINLSDRVPDPDQLCSKLAQLHRTSTSPTGAFGLQTASCQGRTLQHVGWEKSWTTFFTKLLKHVIGLDFETNGYWNELDQLERRLTSHVIPRLIGNLEREGRRVKPCLIHGDLWEGNMGISYDTGDVYVFDAGAYYAHNEMEIGNWRCNYNKIHETVYTKTYLRYYPPSEPKEEWDDRNRMYCIYFNVIYSVNHMAEGTAVRQQ